jgi:UDP-N-acetylmuramate dehydrogenase
MSVQIQSEFFSDIDADYIFDAHIGAMTYFTIGGNVDALVKPHSIEALSLLLQKCHNASIPFRVLGKGANLLIDDIGVDGVVVKLDHDCFTTCTFNREDSSGTMQSMSGADLSKTVMETARNGLHGLQAMAGIPASIGGAIRMNAGGKYGSISDTLSTITTLTTSGEIVTHQASDLGFEYRKSNISDPIILSATFQLIPDDPIKIREGVKEIFAWKKARQPLADTSAGCAFKNPIDEEGQHISAGELIDDAGLKGFTIGGAQVSMQHANFITTTENGTAKDVLVLMNEIRKRVLDHSGIELQKEVVVWSRDSEGNS